MREDVWFEVGEGRGPVRLHGWWFRPEGDGPFPAVVVSHGFSAIKAMGLDAYAEVFVDAGLACLVYDHRNYGDSEGEPRHETDPWQQVNDMRDAVTYVQSRPDVDPERIGAWGTSYAGGHVLVLGALDRRVRAVVSQVPLVSGSAAWEGWVPAAARERFRGRLNADRAARAAGEAPVTTPAAIPGSETEEWAKTSDPLGKYANEFTIRSMELLNTYEPKDFIARISPTPLLMIVALHDTQTPTAGQLEAFAAAGEPKSLVELDCRHYDPYSSHLAPAASAARDWFVEHLGA